MAPEREEIKKLFRALWKQPMQRFPSEHEVLVASLEPGVYIIRKGDVVLHVGSTLRGKNGLRQRLNNHLHGSSSFTNKYLNGNGAALRKRHSFQFLVVKNARSRTLLEAYAIGILCPKHLGLGD